MVFLMADLVLSPKFFPLVVLLGVISNFEFDIKDISESCEPKFELFPYSSPSIALYTSLSSLMWFSSFISLLRLSIYLRYLCSTTSASLIRRFFSISLRVSATLTCRHAPLRILIFSLMVWLNALSVTI